MTDGETSGILGTQICNTCIGYMIIITTLSEMSSTVHIKFVELFNHTIWNVTAIKEKRERNECTLAK